MSGSENKPTNVPFDIPEEDEDEVFSSVLPASAGPRITPSGGFPAVGKAASGPLASLKVLGGSIERTVDVLTSPFQIGRGQGDLRLDDPYVSPFHVQLRASKGSMVIEDLNSRNGVFLRIADELALEDFDEIAIGHQRYIFRTSWDYSGMPSQPYADMTQTMGGDAPTDSFRLVRVLNNGTIARIHAISDTHVIGAQGEFVVESDAVVSTVHAMIERRAGKCFIKDLDSENGTFIRIHDPVDLIEGDCFLVGRTRISVRY